MVMVWHLTMIATGIGTGGNRGGNKGKPNSRITLLVKILTQRLQLTTQGKYQMESCVLFA